MHPDREAVLTLACARRMGPVAFRAAVARAGGAALAELTARQRADAEVRAKQVVEDAEHHGVQVLVQGDDAYPVRVLDLADPPPLLFAKGDVAALAHPMVAIVGTRAASPYGERVARRLAMQLAEHGVAVVSGMARGVDAAAHGGALDAGGLTIAVVAGGVETANPPRHRGLHAAIVDRGVVLGESPCGTPPLPGAFPRRNRIIAALGAATIVVEAGERSGALLTANLAMELGRPVGAVPGQIDSPVSGGTNVLLRDGAAPITGVDDVLLLAGIRPVRSTVSSPVGRVHRVPAPPDGGGLAERVWQLLRGAQFSLDELVVQAGAPPREVLRALTTLEVAGLIRCDASQYSAL